MALLNNGTGLKPNSVNKYERRRTRPRFTTHGENDQKQARLGLSFGTSIRSLAVILNEHFLTSFLLRNVSKDLKAVLASSACPEDFAFVELMSDGLCSSTLPPGTMGLTELLKRQMLTNKRWELWLLEKRRCWQTHSIMTHLTASPTANSLSS